MSAFLDPHKPLSTCSSANCEGCPVRKSVHCHFTAADLTHFFTMFLPIMLVGGLGVVNVQAWGLAPWILLFIGYFGFLEIRVMCSHCPHYAETGASLQCWANYGSPRLWKYRPGPMSRTENALFFAGLVLVFGYPLPFFMIASQWVWLIVYSLMITSGYLSMRKMMCSQCMNFACPLNIVDDVTRQAFFDRNPVVAKAWNRSR